jgi:hypothetical protein
MPAGPRSVAGSVSACRAIRRAMTPLQVKAAGFAGFAVITMHSPRAFPIPVYTGRAAGANALTVPSPDSYRSGAGDRGRDRTASPPRPGPGERAADVSFMRALAVLDHLAHEERQVLPLLEQHLTQAQWRAFLRKERSRRSPRERPEFLAWILDDVGEQDAAAVLAE